MPKAIKDRYNIKTLENLALDIQSVYSSFPKDDFLQFIIDDKWIDLKLKDRIYKISTALGKFLPTNYAHAISIIDKVVMNYGNWLNGFGAFFPIFVEIYGQDEKNWDISMGALERYTPYASSEIAVRPFIINHEERMMAQMYRWSKHENECVRRLSCEGCRPALPWAMALNRFKKDPTPILPILEELKTDSSLHVRKSVANNLNDISKTHPDLVATLAKEWHGENKNADWIIKHGCRTLLKKGNRDLLELFGFENNIPVDIQDFSLNKDTISLGEEISFSFTVSSKEATRVRLEYAIDFVKSGKKTSRKVFRISESSLKANQVKSHTKTHSFVDMSTRKHYPGIHTITLIVNGTQRGTLQFELSQPQ